MKRRLLVLIPLALLLGACASSADPARQSTRQLTEADAGKTVDLSAGQRLEVVLSGNPTTGYSWQVASVDKSVLKSLGDPKYKADTKAVGSGGAYTFAFQGAARGQTALKLDYRRPWETNVAPIKTFQITCVVR